MQTSDSHDRKIPMASSSSYQLPNDAQPPVYTDEDAQALFAPSSGFQRPGAIHPLRLAMVVPQLSLGIESPFVRAYSPELAVSGVEMVDWLKFCDGLVNLRVCFLISQKTKLTISFCRSLHRISHSLLVLR